MRKVHWIILYALVLAGEIKSIMIENQTLETIFKPLIVIVLTGFFLFSTRLWISNLKTPILIALFFSLAGDSLLLFVSKDSLFFLAGLSAFLVAHIGYIIFFNRVRIIENIRGIPWLLLPIVIYYGILITLLQPGLGNMKWPVRIYGIIICFMLLLAIHMAFIKRKGGRWMMMGAILFVISDSLLAINKFYSPFQYAGVFIMLSYGIAQLFIILGAIQYIQSANSR